MPIVKIKKTFSTQTCKNTFREQFREQKGRKSEKLWIILMTDLSRFTNNNFMIRKGITSGGKQIFINEISLSFQLLFRKNLRLSSTVIPSMLIINYLSFMLTKNECSEKLSWTHSWGFIYLCWLLKKNLLILLYILITYLWMPTGVSCGWWGKGAAASYPVPSSSMITWKNINYHKFYYNFMQTKAYYTLVPEMSHFKSSCPNI